MAALNTFVPFDVSSETWESYIERFGCFLEANDLAASEAVLNFCGKQMFDTARALLAPQPLNAVTWEALMAKLKNHYAPTPSQIARRHAFHRREQAEGESVSQFMAGLRTAALHCEFKELDEIWQSTKTAQAQSCMGCGGNHPRAFCRFKNAICQHSGKKGHLARKCRAILPDDRVQAKQEQ
ncbi:hypothetical protein E2320_001403, partial [Naja naja]